MSKLYRKSLIDKLSSPDQLDKEVVISPVSVWVALLGGALIIWATITWSILGTLPVKLNINGILLPEQNSYVVSSVASGIIKEVCVASGDVVQKGGELFILDDEQYLEELSKLRERLNAVYPITLSSRNDVANADTQNLLNIKLQYQTSGDLGAYTSSYDLALEKYNQAVADRESTEGTYYWHQKKIVEVEKAKDDAGNELQAGVQASGLDIASEDNAEDLLKKTKDAIKEKQAMYDLLDPESSEAIELKAEIDELLVLKEKCNSVLCLYKTYDEALSTYNDVNQQLSVAQNNYQLAMNNETYAKQTLDSYDFQLLQNKASSSTQAGSYYKQFYAAKEALISQLSDEIEKYESNIDKLTVIAEADGIVSDLKVIAGATYSQGSTAMTLRQEENSETLVICYVPVSDAKKITEGMSVKVYPTTINQQEYGYIRATVAGVEDYVTSQNQIYNTLGSEELVSAFTQEGPVIAVTCEIEKDPQSVNGFAWSNAKGRTLTIDEGTLVSCDIITEQKRPITMLIPYLKEKLKNFGSAAKEN